MTRRPVGPRPSFVAQSQFGIFQFPFLYSPQTRDSRTLPRSRSFPHSQDPNRTPLVQVTGHYPDGSDKSPSLRTATLTDMPR